jgi:multisubunit Na+/H+ antiporter MnhG subunit
MSDIGDTGDGHTPEGLEGYPYASPQAEQRIKLVTTIVSVIAIGLLLAGLYLALFTTEVLLGTILAVVGFVDLMVVPFLAKSMRRAALQREGRG